MRAYTVATAALALGVDPKWLDNALSHHDVPGVTRSQRGVRRRIPPRSVVIIALSRMLGAELSIPLHRALEIGAGIESGNGPEHRISDALALRVDCDRIRADVLRRLDDAAEFAAVPRRGRRPRLHIDSAP